MSDWSSGYVADIGYTFGYYSELNPLRIKLALLNSSLAIPEIVTACELGYGQGLSANIHAAASQTAWYGTDFNPSQAGFAQELASASGADAKLYDQAFSEFCNRGDLPDFDYIGLHGIWSWISDENRHVIVDFVRRKLKVGGVLYVSYNTLPGWAAFAPMRHLMTEHAEIIGSEGRGIVSRINDAIEFADKLLSTNPVFARANPLVADRVKKLKEQNRHYLAHEYFNRDWHPMHFATMAEWLEPAKVSYACSANYLDHIDVINLTTEQQAFLSEIPDQLFKESVRDFMVNQQFRKDYWIKGPRRLSALEQVEQLRAQKIVLITSLSDISFKINGAVGEVTLTETIYRPIIESLADHSVKSIGQIEAELKDKGLSFLMIVQSIIVLAGAGHVSSVQNDASINKTTKRSKSINAAIINKSRSSADIPYLASPIIGGGVTVDRFQQLFILAMQHGKKQPVEWAQLAWEVLSAQNQRIIKDGKTLETNEENLAELVSQATVFAQKRLSLMRALGVV